MEAKKCTLEKNQYPTITKEIEKYRNGGKECQELINLGLKDFGFLVEFNTLFRLCYLGQKIKEYTTDKKAVLIADLMIIHSMFFSPFYKKIDTIEQL